jgi:ATP-dependent Lhr-like helicase
MRPVLGGWAGNWRLIDDAPPATDPLSELEASRERVHILLDRYGVVNREIANREGGVFRWKMLFKSLRIMELSGEVMQGLFFDGLSGPQFISQRALNRLQRPESLPGTFWCNATDSAAPCGLSLDWQTLPTRRAQNFLSFHQGALALVIENLGRKLHFYLDADHPELEKVLAPCVHIAITRKKMQVDEINGEPVKSSAYLPALKRVLNYRSDHKSVYFE